jgi:pantetheine-phosphate adenylyltransferase
MKKVIYPGTFDPVTNGHLNIIERSAKLFDQVVIAVSINKQKTPLFNVDERVELVKKSISHLSNVSVASFSCLLIDFAKKQQANIIIRGLRAVSDFEFEFQLASMNRRLSSNIESVFLTPSEEFAFVSSSLIREIASLNGDVKDFVPDCVNIALKKKYNMEIKK